MNQRWIYFAATLTGFWWLGNAAVLGQYGGQGASAGTASAGRTTGSQAAGSASSISSAQGYGLDSRYMGSGFSRFTTGSSAIGTTTAGAGAATSGAFGQSAQGGVGGGNFGGGGIGGMSGFRGMGGMGGMGMMNRMGGYGGNMMNAQQSQQGTKRLRTHQRLGFAQPLASAAAINASYSAVIKRVLERGDYGSGAVTLKMEGSTAVLTGIVESSHARDVAERLALLEPGIAEVRNELTLRPAEPTPETSPTSNAGDQPR